MNYDLRGVLFFFLYIMYSAPRKKTPPGEKRLNVQLTKPSWSFLSQCITWGITAWSFSITKVQLNYFSVAQGNSWLLNGIFTLSSDILFICFCIRSFLVFMASEVVQDYKEKNDFIIWPTSTRSWTSFPYPWSAWSTLQDTARYCKIWR